MFFHFHDLGRLVDGELELLPPQVTLIDEVLRACWDTRTAEQMPRESSITREDLMSFIQAAPRGRQPGRSAEGRVPAYHFWLRITGGAAREQIGADSTIAGGIALRIGRGKDIEMYYGHIGYHVYPPSRGHHYAERAVRLLLPLAKLHGLKELWITANPENAASRRTCERLAGDCVEVVDVPSGHPLHFRGETRKCRYRMVIG
ncbi:MAG TPA: GNAT family N-acetyltransferase [Tepidisphaeraceae bacterium]|jgi:tagatose 1,6-diphosphate aldolase